MPSESQTPPLGLVTLSAGQLLIALYMLLLSYRMAHGEVLGRPSQETLLAFASSAPYLALLAVLPAAFSIGLYLMANWARVFALCVYTVLLFGCIWAWVNVLAFGVRIPKVVFNWLLLRTVLYGWVIIYLLRPGVVRAFRKAY